MPNGSFKGRGFTLIELLVVIAILGIIASIAIPMYMGYLKGAKKKAVTENFDIAYRLARTEFAKCGIEANQVTEDIVGSLNSGGKKSPWDANAPAFDTAINSKGQVAIDITDVRSLCGAEGAIEISADQDGDLAADMQSIIRE